MILRCTKRLLDLIRPDVVGAPEPDDDDWYGNVLTIDRRKCLLLTHAGTLFTIFEPGIRAPAVRSTHAFVGALVSRALEAENLPPGALGDIENGSLIVAKTADRGVLGCMNDMAFICEHIVHESGGLAGTDLPALNHRLRRNINSSRDYRQPIDLVRERVAGARRNTERAVHRSLPPDPDLVAGKPAGICQDCSAADPRVSLGGVELCDRCADKRVARLTGYPELPDPPPPLTLADADGHRHVLAYRIWRAPTGIAVELEEQGTPPAEGWKWAVLGDHDDHVDRLVEHLQRTARADLSGNFLQPHPHRDGWLMAGDTLEGRLVWNRQGAEGVGTPYQVIVDGRTLTWEDLGRALEPFEGWRFRIQLEDRLDDLRSDADLLPFPTNPTPEAAVPDSPEPTIDLLLSEFLSDQRQRLAQRTFHNYESVILLLRRCLNNYGYQNLPPADQDRFTAAYESDAEAYVHLFGAQELVAGIPEFLGYFMIRKVMAGEELLRSAGTVTKKLAKWLGEKGYLHDDVVEDTVERGADAARDLPRAERLSRLLFELAQASAVDLHAVEDDDYVEDYLSIERVEPTAIWFEGGIGPLRVPKAVSQLAQVGWSMSVTLARTKGRWELVGAGMVYP